MSNMRDLVKLGLGIALLLVVGYAVLPQYRSAIAVAAPYLLLFLACPIAMYFMMGNMNDSSHEKDKKPEQKDK
jgi:NhaP-type Na+/H+ and K+/H+ antiporter